MALTALRRFRGQREQRAYCRTIANTLGKQFVFRQLPALKEMVLDCVGPDGFVQALDVRALTQPRITLAGDLGSGRQLALRQWALHWATDSSAPMPAIIALQLIDDGETAPEALLERALAATAPAVRHAPKPFARTSGNGSAATAPWGLLIEGLEELPSVRQDVWRTTLQSAPHTAPQSRLVIAVPANEPEWPDFTALCITSPSPERLNEWIGQLAAEPHRAALHSALAPGGSLSVVGERLVEVALLAWVIERTEMPHTRAELFAQAAVSLLRMHPVAGVSMEELQLLAAYNEPPSVVLPEAVQQDASGQFVFMHPLARMYLAAHQLLAEQRFDLVHLLHGTDRREVVRFAAGIANDPTALFTALWSAGPSADDVLTLGRCLRERTTGPHWMLRIVGALALLTRGGRTPQREEAMSLLRAIAPQLDQALLSAAQGDSALQQAVPRVLAVLPPELAAERAARFAFHPQADDALAWQVADLLTEQSISADALPTPPATVEAFARWTYVVALHSTQSRERLTGAMNELVSVLRRSTAGDARLVRVAGALIDDVQLPEHARAAGLKLLEHNRTPDTLLVAERASHDPSEVVRRAAQASLVQHDPEYVRAVLGKTALDPLATPDVRLSAIQQLGLYSTAEARGLLERCAFDDTLPLYARLVTVAVLGRAASGGVYLQAILHTPDAHPAVRAAAAHAIGALNYQAAQPGMLGLLTSALTPPELAEALCESLGALGNASAVVPLLRVLERAGADLALTLAAVRALGELRAREATPLLSRLLGTEAYQRLLSASGQLDSQQNAEELVQAQALPPRMHDRLITALNGSCVPAERPTTLEEFLQHEADLVRAAAAQTLAQIGGEQVVAALLAALVDNATAGATNQVIAALAQLDTSDTAMLLGSLLNDPEVTPMTRWLVVQQLRNHPDGVDVMLRALAQHDIDTFTRGELAEALGQRGAVAALPLLRQLAEDPRADEHLRAQAMFALGLIDDPSTEVSLIQIVRTSAENDTLRGLAAEQLPSGLSTEARQFLRDLLRRDHPPEPLLNGALRTLAQVRDREALPLLLRYCQDERPAVAQTAILGFIKYGDTRVAPTLVRVSQNTHADAATRLQAIGTLLKIGGESYLPLLWVLLERGPLPLRLQALEHLLDAQHSTMELLGMLADTTWPLPLRLRLLEHCGGQAETQPVLLRIVEDAQDDVQLRCQAARALGRSRYEAAIAPLAEVAQHPDTPLPLGVQCVLALGAFGGIEAGLALSHFTDDPHAPHVLRTVALRQCSVHAIDPSEEFARQLTYAVG